MIGPARVRGLTLIELVLGLSVFFGLLFGAFVFARAVRHDHLATTVAAEVTMIAEAAKRGWAAQPNYATLSNASLAPHLPRGLQALQGAAGYPYLVYPVDYYDTAAALYIQASVPRELCAKLAVQSAPGVHWIAIFDGATYHMPWYRNTMAAPHPLAVAAACAASSRPIFFWGVL